MAEKKGFLESLMDFSFRECLTPRMTKLLYSLHLLVGLIVAIWAVITEFNVSPADGVLGLILAIIALFFWILYCRIAIEFLVAVFRIADAAVPPPPENR
jgi:multisubunit Na+/H+ antiporter MnhE subunit